MTTKILLLHNSYQYRGGEEAVFSEELNLLQKHSHQVVTYTRNNAEIQKYTHVQKIQLIKDTHWSNQSYQEVMGILEIEKPDIAHFHNTLPLISPAAYYACQEARVPVVQSLHNYRLMCLPATFFRNGKTCELCMDKSFPWPGILYGCYRNSRVQSAVVASMLFYHRMKSTWQTQVDVYVALTNFAKQKLIRGGIPEEKIHIKPNFVQDPVFEPEKRDGNYALFVGRLSEEKGILQMLAVWSKISDLPLKIIGAGPLSEKAQLIVEELNLANVEMLGYLIYEDMIRVMKSARFLIFPTLVYETFGRVVIEAYSCGVPVLASRIGAVEELVKEGETGLLFDPYDTEDMISKITWMNTHPNELRVMGENARREYERYYTPEVNYQKLIEIYEIARKKS